MPKRACLKQRDLKLGVILHYTELKTSLMYMNTLQKKQKLQPCTYKVGRQDTSHRCQHHYLTGSVEGRLALCLPRMVTVACLVLVVQEPEPDRAGCSRVCVSIGPLPFLHSMNHVSACSFRLSPVADTSGASQPGQGSISQCFFSFPCCSQLYSWSPGLQTLEFIMTAARFLCCCCLKELKRNRQVYERQSLNTLLTY